MTDDEQHPQRCENWMTEGKSSKGDGEAPMQPTDATGASIGEEQSKVTIDYQVTPEEETYGRLLDERWEMLSGAARTMVSEAQLAAYATYMVHSYCGFQQEEYEDTMEKLRHAAAKLVGQDREILSKIVDATKAAAASIDEGDKTPAGYKIDRGDVHRYYKMVSGMLGESISDELFFVRVPQSES